MIFMRKTRFSETSKKIEVCYVAKVSPHLHLYFSTSYNLHFRKQQGATISHWSVQYGRTTLSNFGFVLPRRTADRARRCVRRHCSKDRAFLLKPQSGARTLVQVPRNTLTIWNASTIKQKAFRLNIRLALLTASRVNAIDNR